MESQAYFTGIREKIIEHLQTATDNVLVAEVRHLFAKIPVFVPRPANEFKYLPQFSGAKQKMYVVARCAF